MQRIIAIPIVLLFTLSRPCLAQDDPVMSAKMQFSSILMGTNNSFSSLKGDKVGEDDNYMYYRSEYGLGNKALTVLHSKKDTTEWLCFVRYSTETDLDQIPAIESGVFGMINMVIKGGKIKGTEGTENNVTRTDLYVTQGEEWLGELVTDSNKKTFHVLFRNTKWN